MKISVLTTFLALCVVAITAIPVHDIVARTSAVEVPRGYVPADLEPRQAAGFAKDGLSLLKNILEDIERDNQARGRFTQELVSRMNQKDSSFNYVVCHSKHTYSFAGTRGTDWGHSHQEFDIKVGGTRGYEIYWFRSGKFTLQGDGGFLNWAYNGNVISKSENISKTTDHLFRLVLGCFDLYRSKQATSHNPASRFRNRTSPCQDFAHKRCTSHKSDKPHNPHRLLPERPAK
ncbi:hypothetical protein Hypma_005461 [Hypsizygus marmoreus]|uniref:DUF7888 domain-containing protein n=1 Tax=Hypsizygus marmoreus TaxID=39966 RepID=A0A369J3W2_HYPMA|nr:hypothetical protein Hypma_005461 [Hypsizygus marmoreus]